MDFGLRSELAVLGLRARPPLRRRSGAGPSDDGHWVLDGAPATLPVKADSPWAIRGDGALIREGVIVDAALRAVRRPRFYELRTADGIPYEQIARLHGRYVLATTVVQTCVRYKRDSRCRFCTIEEPLRSGETARVKLPEQIAEVARAAVRLDGVRQLVMTTGTSNGPDRGARHLTRCVMAVKDVLPDLPIQVQIEPPDDLAWIKRLRNAGTTAIGIHVESLDEEVRRRWTPGKAKVSLERYEEAWTEAVTVFGRNRVSTYLLIGLGENPDELVKGAERLIAMGVYPFVVPYRPLAGALAHADGVPAPSHELVADITDRVGRALRKAGMAGADQGAGLRGLRGLLGAVRRRGMSARYSGVASSTSVPNGSRTYATRWPCGLSFGSASASQPASSACWKAPSTSSCTSASSTFGGWPSRAARRTPPGKFVLTERVRGEAELRRAGVELRVVADGELDAHPEDALVERGGLVGRRRRRR